MPYSNCLSDDLTSKVIGDPLTTGGKVRTPRQIYAAWARSTLGLEARAAMYRRQLGICLCCTKAVPLGMCEIDHYIPLTQPGVNPVDEANMYVVCRPCNRRKGPRKAMYAIQVVQDSAA